MKVWTAEEIHKVMIDKGWWEWERNCGEIFANIYSELSEACDFLRGLAPRAQIIYEGEKPEGFLIEIVDCMIRVMDLFGHEGQDSEDYKTVEAWNKVFGKDGCWTEEVRICLAMSHLGKAWNAYRSGEEFEGPNGYGLHLSTLLIELDYLCVNLKQNCNDLIDKKMQYNLKRPYRHGGKKA